MTSPPANDDKAPNSRLQPKRVWFVPVASAAVGALVLLAVGTLAIAVAWNFAGQGPKARIAITQARRTTIEQAVTSHKLTTGSCPAMLNQLVPNFLTTVPLDAWQRPFIYTPTLNGPTPFDLRSAGPDGIAGTADDI